MYIPPFKILIPALEKMNQLRTSQSFTFHIAGHYFDQRNAALSKDDDEFSFAVSYPVIPGIELHEEFRFSANDSISLVGGSEIYFTNSKNIIVTDFTRSGDFSEKTAKGKITSLATTSDLSVFDNKFIRCIIPLKEEEQFSLNDFQTQWFEHAHGNSGDFISVAVDGIKIDFFHFRTDTENFICFDCHSAAQFETFQKKCFSILLSHGFLKGIMLHNEAYYFSYPDQKMDEPLEMAYISMRASIVTQQPVFVSSAFGMHQDLMHDDDDAMRTANRKKVELLNEDMDIFPTEVFSKLATLLYQKEKLQRAALIYIQSHIASLEVRIPNYYVAIEAITGHIADSTEKKKFNPIKNKKLASKFIEDVTNLAKSVKSNLQLSEDEFNLDIMIKNINRLNAPPNADKLSSSFSQLGYNLSKEQKDLLKDRNVYLHGSFLKILGREEVFQQALHVSLRLHFMIAVLLLKLSGFSGYIINYAELWSYMTDKQLGESRVVKI